MAAWGRGHPMRVRLSQSMETLHVIEETPSIMRSPPEAKTGSSVLRNGVGVPNEIRGRRSGERLYRPYPNKDGGHPATLAAMP